MKAVFLSYRPVDHLKITHFFIQIEIMNNQSKDNINIKMSYIIDNPDAKYFHNFVKKQPLNKKHQVETAEKSIQKLDRTLKQLIKCLELKIRVFCSQKNDHCTGERVVLEPIPLFAQLSVVLTFVIDQKKDSLIQLKIDLIDQHLSYFNAGSHQRRITLNKLLYLNQKMIEMQVIKLNIDMHNGRVAMDMPFHIFAAKGQLQNLSSVKRRNFLSKIIYHTLTEAKNSVSLLLILMGEESSIPIIKEFNQLKACRDHKIDSLYRYHQMLMIKRGEFDQPQNKIKSFIKESKNRYEQSVSKLIRCRVQMDVNICKNIILFQCHKSNFKELIKQNQFKIEEEQKQNILRLIDQPILSKSNNGDNIIYIKDPYNLKLAPINSGGFANIFITEIEYWPMALPKNANLPPVRKYMVIKKQNAQDRSKGRNLHEKLIISKLKGSSSVLFNTYYTTSNKPNPFQSDVIMDYIPFPNLTEYAKLNKSSISMQTKIHLMFMLVQALRILKDNDIVHADVKPSNVLTYCNLFLKLIDFGESYHPLLCKNDYRPGFSIPYSSPEAHRLPYFLTDKSDLFSMGIIFHQLLQGSTPFYFYKDSSIKKYKTDEYLSHWFFSPEEGNSNGDLVVLPLLTRLISQCMHSEPSERPQLTLVSLVLRQCLQVLH